MGVSREIRCTLLNVPSALLDDIYISSVFLSLFDVKIAALPQSTLPFSPSIQLDRVVNWMWVAYESHPWSFVHVNHCFLDNSTYRSSRRRKSELSIKVSTISCFSLPLWSFASLYMLICWCTAFFLPGITDHAVYSKAVVEPTQKWVARPLDFALFPPSISFQSSLSPTYILF